MQKSSFCLLFSLVALALAEPLNKRDAPYEHAYDKTHPDHEAYSDHEAYPDHKAYPEHEAYPDVWNYLESYPSYYEVSPDDDSMIFFGNTTFIGPKEETPYINETHITDTVQAVHRYFESLVYLLQDACGILEEHAPKLFEENPNTGDKIIDIVAIQEKMDRLGQELNHLDKLLDEARQTIQDVAPQLLQEGALDIQS